MLLVFLGVSGVSADEFTSTDFKILEPVIVPAGYATSTDFQLISTITQVAIGTSTATDFNISGGFLYFPFANLPVVTATAGEEQVSLSWTASTGVLGWTVSGYDVGQSTTAGGPYTYTSVGNVTSYTADSLTGGTTYYFVVRPEDAFSNAVATSSEVSAVPTAGSVASAAVDGSGSGSSGILNIWGKSEPTLTTNVLEGISEAGRVIGSLLFPKKPDELLTLPKDLKLLSRKFPKLADTLVKLGIKNPEDVAKLSKIQLSLPHLGEVKNIPTEIVFASLGDSLLYFTTDLVITDEGNVTESVKVVSGQDVNLSVKPDAVVRSITGYIVLKESKFGSRPSFSASSLIAAVMMLEEDFTQSETVIEERQLLQTFSYTDPDGDGVYTASITVPLASSDYEIITVFNYEYQRSKEIRLTLVVDPEGYVFEMVGGKEARVPNAVVTIFNENDSPWPASDYQQNNPQTTDKSGEYSFLVPEGKYYIVATHPDYKNYRSVLFTVRESRGIHINIEMESKFGFLNNLGWWWLILIVLLIVIVLLGYNFYRDLTYRKNE